MTIVYVPTFEWGWTDSVDRAREEGRVVEGEGFCDHRPRLVPRRHRVSLRLERRLNMEPFSESKLRTRVKARNCESRFTI